MKYFCLSFLFFLIVFFYPSNTFASENFVVGSDVNYSVSENGKTHVTFTVDLTNTTSQYYASSYKINIGLENIENVRATDPIGEINPTTAKTATGYEIEISFNKRVVGLGKTLSFTLSFDTPDIAQKQGNVWVVNVPGISNSNDFSNFNVHVDVPESFQLPSYTKPKQQNTSSLFFTKDILGKSGISLGFGTQQQYEFMISYHIENTHVFPIKTEIALPPSTNYQDVYISNIDPRPSNVVLDEDGNWLAQYSLIPSERQDIVVRGHARVLLYPRKQQETEENLQKYTQQSQYWETKNREIQTLASELKTPKAIYEYVVKNLNYDFSRVTQSQKRAGALKALKNPSSAVCLEFTDLFIALSRAAGIPARELNGFAYTENSKQRPLSLVKDVLHAWPEYYDRGNQTWIMVDPTWGNTTGGIDYFDRLDFDHFVFVIKGKSSTYPIPAGGYKLAGKQKKDVLVTFATSLPKEESKITLKESLPNTAFPGIQISGSVKIENKGPSMRQSMPLIIESDFLSPKKIQFTINNIPPFGYVSYPFQFQRTSLLTNTQAVITIRYGDFFSSGKIRVSVFTINEVTIVIGGVLIATSLTIVLWSITRKARSIHLRQQSEENSLRR